MFSVELIAYTNLRNYIVLQAKLGLSPMMMMMMVVVMFFVHCLYLVSKEGTAALGAP